ncbi:hypothetical protein K6T25_07520 [Halobaculum rubrum]|nr:hypothetical protein K6T25_07520 [Halobaculum rubrum]
MLLGVVILGLIEVLAGQPYGAAPLTNEAGDVIATPAIDPVVRTGLVILGLVVLLMWGVYRAITVDPPADRTTTEVTAD